MRGTVWAGLIFAALAPSACASNSDSQNAAPLDVEVWLTDGVQALLFASTERCDKPLKAYGAYELQRTCENFTQTCILADVAVDVTDGTHSVRLTNGKGTPLTGLAGPLSLKSTSPAFEVPVTFPSNGPTLTAPQDGDTASLTEPLTLSWGAGNAVDATHVEISMGEAGTSAGCLPYRLGCELPLEAGSSMVPPAALNGFVSTFENTSAPTMFLGISPEWKHEQSVSGAHVTVRAKARSSTLGSSVHLALTNSPSGARD